MFDIILIPLLSLFSTVISLYIWCLVGGAILSWLVYFQVINSHHVFVRAAGQFLYKITEPALRPLRRWLPAWSGLDLSPLVLILFLTFLQNVLMRIFLKLG